MRVAVAGATGVLGQHVVTALTRLGHEPVLISRSTGVDLTSGEGLERALQGSAAVIDASATDNLSSKASIAFFGAATARLLEAERNAGVPHHVAISIIGAAQIAKNYYAGKALQERMLFEQPEGWSMLRTTQFHEFVYRIIDAASIGRFHLVPRMRTQPVAAREVADALVRIALGEPQGLAPDLAGPTEERMADLVRRYFAAKGERRNVLEVPLPGRWGKGMRDGSLLPAPGTALGTQTFDEWLAAEVSA